MNAVVSPATGARPLAASVAALVRFDLRRFRGLAALVVVLEAARAVFVEWSLRRPAIIGDDYGGAFGPENTVPIDVVLALATAVATARLVQADLPSDSRSFWRTRPIAPLALSLGKATTLALLFAAVPVGVNSMRLLAHGAPAASIAAAALQVAVHGGGLVVPAWGFALATRTLPRFIAAALALALGGAVVVNALAFWVMRGATGVGSSSIGMPDVAGDWQGLTEHGWWTALLATLASLAVVAAHYHHRRRLLSLTAAIVVAAVPALLPARMESTPTTPDLQRRIAGRLGVATLRLPPRSMLDATRQSDTPFPLWLTPELALPDLGPDVSAWVILRGVRLTGRATVAPTDASLCCYGVDPAGVLGAVRAMTPSPGGGPPFMTSRELDTLRDAPVDVHATAEVHLQRHHLAGDIPLRPGAAFAIDGQVLEVLAIEAERSAVLIRWTTFPTLDPRPSTVALFVGDAARTLVVATTAGWQRFMRPRQAFWAANDRLTGRSWVRRFHVLVSDAATLNEDARLFVVVSRDAGTVSMPLAVDDVPVREARDDRSR